MPQKKAKKAKAEKPKKPVKAAKAAGLGAALKKVAKDLGKKVAVTAAKKTSAAPQPKKAVAPVKAEKPGKKGAESAKKVAAPTKAEKQGKVDKKAAAAPALSLVKGKEKTAPAGKPEKVAKGIPAAKVEGKKKGEVVVVVPAPKGVAILTKDGKKKGKSASESSISKKNRCREPGCDLDFTLVGYCRLHYIKNWRRIKRKESILASGQLNNYVEELVNKYPDKYLDVIREDLATEKQWSKVVTDLELEGNDDDTAVDDDNEAVPEGVRPASGGGGGGGRGEFDDEGDAF